MTEYDNVLCGSGILANSIRDALATDRAIKPIYGHKILPLNSGVLITGGTTYDYFKYTETDKACGARTLRLDKMAFDILNTIKKNVLKTFE
jgi:hypothetical protein